MACYGNLKVILALPSVYGTASNNIRYLFTSVSAKSAKWNSSITVSKSNENGKVVLFSASTEMVDKMMKLYGGVHGS